MVRVRIARCEASNIMETYFNKNPLKVCGLREDSLAQLLSYANVHSGSRVLVFESCMGVVAGAVAQRLGDHGQALVAYDGQQAGDNAVSRYNLSLEARTRVIVNFPLDSIPQLAKSEETIAAEDAAFLAANPRLSEAQCASLAAQRQQRYTPEQQALFDAKKADREARLKLLRACILKIL